MHLCYNSQKVSFILSNCPLLVSLELGSSQDIHLLLDQQAMRKPSKNKKDMCFSVQQTCFWCLTSDRSYSCYSIFSAPSLKQGEYQTSQQFLRQNDKTTEPETHCKIMDNTFYLLMISCFPNYLWYYLNILKYIIKKKYSISPYQN